MPYSFSRLFEELTGRPFKNRPTFQPPALTPLRKTIAESTVGIFTSCGAQLLEDPNVAFPLDRMKELEADGTIGRLAHTAISMVGSIQRFTDLVEQTVPAI